MPVISNIDLGKLLYQKSIRLVHISTEAKSYFSSNIVISEMEKIFQNYCLKFLLLYWI